MDSPKPTPIPLAIGITNRHGAESAKAWISGYKNQGVIDDETFNTSINQLDKLVSDKPEPSFEKFKVKEVHSLPPKAVELLSSIPEEFGVRIAHAMVVRDNNELILGRYIGYSNEVGRIAIAEKNLFQRGDGKVTTVGYQLALFYTSIGQILGDLALGRKYLETVNDDTSLVAFSKGYSLEQLKFLAVEFKLFDVIAFSSANQNGFVSSAKDLASLCKKIIDYVEVLHLKDQVEIDSSLLFQAKSSANATIALNIPSFGVSFDKYSSLFTQLDSAFFNTVKMLHFMKFHKHKFDAEVAGVDKDKFIPLIEEIIEKIFGNK